MFSTEFWWTIAGIALMISELAAPGLILFFFGIGALFTALATWIFPLSLAGQIAVFILTSLTSLFALRRFLKPIFSGNVSPSTDAGNDTDELTGSIGKVVLEIGPRQAGRIHLNGVTWKAVASQPIAVGTPVEVIAQNNLTLTVTPKS